MVAPAWLKAGFTTAAKAIMGSTYHSAFPVFCRPIMDRWLAAPPHREMARQRG